MRTILFILLVIAVCWFAADCARAAELQVPANAGGSLEYVQNAYRLAGEFELTFHHFQVLATELITPKVLLCPADTRRPAATFAVLKDQNLSYFVGVNSDYARPNSILSGDRNLGLLSIYRLQHQIDLLRIETSALTLYPQTPAHERSRLRREP